MSSDCGRFAMAGKMNSTTVRMMTLIASSQWSRRNVPARHLVTAASCAARSAPATLIRSRWTESARVYVQGSGGQCSGCSHQGSAAAFIFAATARRMVLGSVRTHFSQRLR
jgi:hypothetical protein